MVDDGSEIVGVRQKEGAVTHVAVLHPVEHIISEIESGNNEYFTHRDGTRAKVYVKGFEHEKFLTTNPDDTKKNNLDFLGSV